MKKRLIGAVAQTAELKSALDGNGNIAVQQTAGNRVILQESRNGECL